MAIARAVLMAMVLSALLAAGCDDDPGTSEDRVALDWQVTADAYAPGALLSAWAGGPDDVWMVGGEEAAGVVLHWDGAAWTRRDPGVDQQLWWVHGFEGGPVWVVGDRGVTARWQDGAWETFDAGVPGTTLYGIWGATPDDLWAVGGPSQRAPSAEREGDVVLRWDGEGWERQTIQALLDKPASAGKNLFKVWGAAADRVFVVGDSGIALHFDGAQWRREETGVTATALFTVWGRGEDDVYAVGGGSAPVLLRWDGAAWAEVPLPPEAPQVLQGVWTAPNASVYIVGWYGFAARLDGGTRWTVGEASTANAFHAIVGDGAGALWAVGGDIYAFQADYDGTIATTRADVPAPPAP